MSRRVLLVTRVDAVWSRLAEFHDYWRARNLPFWEQNGARHVGSFVNHLGGPKSQVLRLFEFDSLEHCQRFLAQRETMFQSERGQQQMAELQQYLECIEESVWISAY